jgi:hypothetical protein
VPAFLFLHAGSLVHYRPPFSRDPAPRVAFSLKKSFHCARIHRARGALAFCKRCGDTGLRLASATAVIDTPHPICEGRAFSWRSDSIEERPILQYSGTRTAESKTEVIFPTKPLPAAAIERLPRVVTLQPELLSKIATGRARSRATAAPKLN